MAVNDLAARIPRIAKVAAGREDAEERRPAACVARAGRPVSGAGALRARTVLADAVPDAVDVDRAGIPDVAGRTALTDDAQEGRQAAGVTLARRPLHLARLADVLLVRCGLGVDRRRALVVFRLERLQLLVQRVGVNETAHEVDRETAQFVEVFIIA